MELVRTGLNDGVLRTWCQGGAMGYARPTKVALES